MVVIEIEMTFWIYLVSESADPVQNVILAGRLLKVVIVEMFIADIPLNEPANKNAGCEIYRMPYNKNGFGFVLRREDG